MIKIIKCEQCGEEQERYHNAKLCAGCAYANSQLSQLEAFENFKKDGLQ